MRLDSGGKATREIVRHPGAVAVLAQDAVGKFLLVRQFRKPAEKELLEVIAGTLEKGEDPRQCAAREVAEEIGRRVGRLVKLGTLFLAPGYSTEKIHIFYARLKPGRVKAEADNDEAIDVVELRAAGIEKMMASGRIEDAKTVAAWALFKARMKSDD